MSILNKFNKGTQFTFRTPTEFEYSNLKDLVKEHGIKNKHRANALYINTKSRYGDHPVAVTDTAIVNLPAHLLESVKEMIQEPEVVELANAGKLGFEVYEYEGANGKGHSITWIDLNDILQ